MTTSRDSAKSPEQIKEEARAKVADMLSRTIEYHIQTFGKEGFFLNAADVAGFLHGPYRQAALAAIDEVVERYKRAGWSVVCQLPGVQGEETGVLLTFH